jgi:tRNA U34 5-carboxymethylaminomethyl modifying GTPase MnmE/TrmE
LAKGLADLINAETELQRSQALSQMEGALSSVYKEWRQSIIKCLANIEAYIDFSEDENVEDNILQESNTYKRYKT